MLMNSATTIALSIGWLRVVKRKWHSMQHKLRCERSRKRKPITVSDDSVNDEDTQRKEDEKETKREAEMKGGSEIPICSLLLVLAVTPFVARNGVM